MVCFRYITVNTLYKGDKDDDDDDNNKRKRVITHNQYLLKRAIRSKIRLIHFSYLKLNPALLPNEVIFLVISSRENSHTGQYSYDMYSYKLASKYYKNFLVSFFLRSVRQQQNRMNKDQLSDRNKFLTIRKQ